MHPLDSIKMLRGSQLALESVIQRLTRNPGQLDLAVGLTEAPRPVILTGVGRSFTVAQHGAGLLATVGVHATACHATDLLHGGLGLVPRAGFPSRERATVIMISHSGRTTELQVVSSQLHNQGDFTYSKIVITGSDNPLIDKNADVVLDYEAHEDGSVHGTIPSVSVTAQLAWLNVIACRHADILTREQLGSSHPGGRLGLHYRGVQ